MDWPDAPEAPTTGGMARPARVLATADALPVVGAAGTVLDLPTSVVPGTGAVARAEPLVLARADTPDSVLAEVGTPRPGSELSREVVEGADDVVAGRFAGYYSRLSDSPVVAYDASNVLTVVEGL